MTSTLSKATMEQNNKGKDTYLLSMKNTIRKSEKATMEHHQLPNPQTPKPLGGNTADKNKDQVRQAGPGRGAMRPEGRGISP